MSDFNYFRSFIVDGYDFPVTPQSNFGFISQGMYLLNRGSYTVLYSFNGETVHGDLNPSDGSIGISFDHRFESKVWFKSVDGYGVVRVEAWK